MDFAVTAQAVLGWLVRGVGAMWLVGSVALLASLRREAQIDRMIAGIDKAASDLTDAIDAASEDDDPPAVRRSPEQQAARDWEDRDDRSRRRWLALQSVLLAVTGLSMLFLHLSSAALVAALVAAQGFYFLWRERTAKSAPTADLAREARPKRDTVNAGWFSLGVATLVWAAAIQGLLGCFPWPMP